MNIKNPLVVLYTVCLWLYLTVTALARYVLAPRFHIKVSGYETPVYVSISTSGGACSAIKEHAMRFTLDEAKAYVEFNPSDIDGELTIVQCSLYNHLP